MYGGAGAGSEIAKYQKKSVATDFKSVATDFKLY